MQTILKMLRLFVSLSPFIVIFNVVEQVSSCYYLHQP